MRIRGVGRLRRVARRLRNRLARRALILLYHRVVELPSDLHLICVTPQHLAEHLEVLRTYGRPMRLCQLAESLRDRNLPHRAVVVTFDDGYADNFSNAKPLLERYNVPATVFVTAGYIGREREFWWDELERLLLQPGRLPETLCLNISQSPCHWELGEAACYSDNDYRRHHCWNMGQKEDPSLRHRLYRSLYQLLCPLPEVERRQILDALRAWAGAAPIARATHRALSVDEVFRLGEGELIEVGAHTVTHPILSSLSAAAQWHEIHGSKLQLEEMVGRTVTSFAYPYGSRLRSDYTAETVGLVRQAGFTCACSYLAEAVRPGADRFQLSRCGVRDWDGDEFARRLKMWFDD